MKKLLFLIPVLFLLAPLASASDDIIFGVHSFQQIRGASDEAYLTDNNIDTYINYNAGSPDKLNGTYDPVGNSSWAAKVSGFALKFWALDASSPLGRMSVYGSDDNFTTISLVYNESTFLDYTAGGSPVVRNLTFTESSAYRYFNVLLETDSSGAGGQTAYEWWLYGTKEVSAGADTFTLTAIDTYDSSAITNFTAILFNSTDTYINTTTTGSITWDNLTGIYNITINSTENGGYFNHTFGNKNVSSDFQGNLTQSYLSLNVTDLLSGTGLSSFTVYTNYTTHSGTNGYILLPSKAGFHTFNITSTQYPLHEFSYTISALENLSFTANVSPQFNFYLRREADDSIFDWNGTNTTKLMIYCPDKNIEVNFNTSSNANVTVDCPYTLMRMAVTYSSSSYFRTLIPPTTQQNVTWWLLDLNKDTGVQIIVELIDLVGDWASGLLRVTTAIGANDEDIIEQEFDISDAVTLYLLKDGLYTLSIENDEGSERTLGSLIADAAGTKTITYPNIPFYPEETILENNISWSYTFNTTAQILRLQYEDTTAKTTYLRWRIYNGTNTSHLLSSFTANTNSSLIFTYQPIYANNTYFTHLFMIHPDLDYNISEYKVFSDYERHLGIFEGFDDKQDIAMYVSIIFLVVWGLLFSAKHVGIGLTSTFIWVIILKQWGFFPINALQLGLIGFVVILGWVVEVIKK